ncbi:unnamed protein product [Diatraea saccharalis]|uniref:Tetraspanin n=1 Tax=Diatraea saccharalis TaxID=40085 RepID=A0A9N9R994_9NEOP|nr:unnamed protein product [Diatraea saccharalis]
MGCVEVLLKILLFIVNFVIGYGIFIILLTAVNIYVVVVVYINKDAAENTISDFLNKQFEDPDMRNTFYFIEYVFGCCGTTGADSYDIIELTIPPTCCPNANFPSLNDIGNIEDMINNLNGTAEFCAKEETFSGCSPLVTNLFITIFDVVAWILIGTLIVQVIVIVSSFYLAGSARKYRGKMVGLFLIGVTSFFIVYAVALANIIEDEDYDSDRFIYVTVLGIVTFIISCMGCCGAIAEKPSLLNMEKCCGTTGADSYKIYGLEIPPTCCPGLDFPYFHDLDSIIQIQDILITYNKTEHTCLEITSYDGCLPYINEFITFFYDFVNNVSIIVLATQVIAAIFAFYLAQHIRNEVAAKNSPKSYTLRVKEKV